MGGISNTRKRRSRDRTSGSLTGETWVKSMTSSNAVSV